MMINGRFSPLPGWTFNKVVTCGDTILQNPSCAEVLFKWSVLLQWYPCRNKAKDGQVRNDNTNMGMDQYLLIPFLGG